MGDRRDAPSTSHGHGRSSAGTTQPNTGDRSPAHGYAVHNVFNNLAQEDDGDEGRSFRSSSPRGGPSRSSHQPQSLVQAGDEDAATLLEEWDRQAHDDKTRKTQHERSSATDTDGGGRPSPAPPHATPSMAGRFIEGASGEPSSHSSVSQGPFALLWSAQRGRAKHLQATDGRSSNRQGSAGGGDVMPTLGPGDRRPSRRPSLSQNSEGRRKSYSSYSVQNHTEALAALQASADRYDVELAATGRVSSEFMHAAGSALTAPGVGISTAFARTSAAVDSLGGRFPSSSRRSPASVNSSAGFFAREASSGGLYVANTGSAPPSPPAMSSAVSGAAAAPPSPARRKPGRRATVADLGAAQAAAKQMLVGGAPLESPTNSLTGVGSISIKPSTSGATGSGGFAIPHSPAGSAGSGPLSGAGGSSSSNVRSSLLAKIIAPVSHAMSRSGLSALRAGQVVTSSGYEQLPATVDEEDDGLQAPRLAAHSSEHNSLTADAEGSTRGRRTFARPSGPQACGPFPPAISPRVVSLVSAGEVGTRGPSHSELQLMGAASSVSFKKSTNKQGIIRPLTTLPAFVPRLLKEEILQNHARYQAFDAMARDLPAASRTLKPSMTEFEGAVMIGDVKGFTQLTEILSKKGTAGVELLTTCMNNYFTRVINMILAYDGDVIKFAGDSMIVAFKPREDEQSAPDAGLRAATQRCAACAHELATRLGHMRMKLNGQVEPVHVAANGSLDNKGTVEEVEHMEEFSRKDSSPSSALPAPRIRARPAGASMSIDSPRNSAVVSSRFAQSSGMGYAGVTAGRMSGSGIVGTIEGTAPAVLDEQMNPNGTQSDLTSAATAEAPRSASFTNQRSKRRSWLPGMGMLRKVGAGGGGGAVSAPSRQRQSEVVGSMERLLEQHSNATSATSSVGTPAAGSRAGATGMADAGWGRTRAITDTGLTLLRGMGAGVVGVAGGRADASGTGNSTAQTSVSSVPEEERTSAGRTLWGNDETLGVTKRESSLNTKLAIPPPVRAMASSQMTVAAADASSARNSNPPNLALSLNMLHTNHQRTSTSSIAALLPQMSGPLGASTPPSPHGVMRSHITGGVSPSTMLGGVSPTSNSPRSFTERSAGLGNSAAFARHRTSALGAHSPSASQQEVSPHSSANSGWQAKLLNLASGVTALAGGRGSHFNGSSPGGSSSHVALDAEDNRGKRSAVTGSGVGMDPQAAHQQHSSEAAPAGAVDDGAESDDSGDGYSSIAVEDRSSNQQVLGTTILNGLMGLDLNNPSPRNSPGSSLRITPGLLPSSNPHITPQQRALLSLQQPGTLVNGAVTAAVNPAAAMAAAAVAAAAAEATAAAAAAAAAVQPYPLHGAVGLPFTGPARLHGRTGAIADPSQRSTSSSLSGTATTPTQPTTLSSRPVAEGLSDAEVDTPVVSQPNSPPASRRMTSGALQDTVGGGPARNGPSISSKSGVGNNLLTRVVSWFSLGGLSTAASGSVGRGGGGQGDRNNPTSESFSQFRADDNEQSFLGSHASTSGPSRTFGPHTAAASTLGPGGGAAPANHSHNPVTAQHRQSMHVGGTGHANHPQRVQRGDPILEEVQNSTFSIKIMVSAGVVCVFHVGGHLDEVVDPTMPELPRWEFFVGDRPLAPALDEQGRRYCITQLAEIEKHADAGDVVASHEVLALIQDDWDVKPLSDQSGLLLQPSRPNSQPQTPAVTAALLAEPKPKGAGRLFEGPAVQQSRTSMPTLVKTQSTDFEGVLHGPNATALLDTMEPSDTIADSGSLFGLKSRRQVVAASTPSNIQQNAQSASPAARSGRPSQPALSTIASEPTPNSTAAQDMESPSVLGPVSCSIPFASVAGSGERHAGSFAMSAPRSGGGTRFPRLLGPAQPAVTTAITTAAAAANEAAAPTANAVAAAGAAASTWTTYVTPAQTNVALVPSSNAPIISPAPFSHTTHTTTTMPLATAALPFVGVPTPMLPDEPSELLEPLAFNAAYAAAAASKAQDPPASPLRAACPPLGNARSSNITYSGDDNSDGGSDDGAMGYGPPVRSTAAPANAARAGHSLGGAQHEFSSQPEHLQRRMACLLRMHMLGSVRTKIEAGHLDFINEIRPLTCLFIGFPSLLQPREGATHADQVDCVQHAMVQVQDVMRRRDGSLLQFRCDEKGFLAICAFGLPGQPHADNPSRGIAAALELRKRIYDAGHRVCIGVTTGDLLCTCVGARKIRTEYTVFGDAINLSARLMVKCKNGTCDILCDAPTHAHAKYKADYEELVPLTVKGKQLPVVVFSVAAFEGAYAAGKARDKGRSEKEGEEQGGGTERKLVGRDEELGILLTKVANLVSGAAGGGVIAIEGNTGMGKTKLLTEVRKKLEAINSAVAQQQQHYHHPLHHLRLQPSSSQRAIQRVSASNPNHLLPRSSPTQPTSQPPTLTVNGRLTPQLGSNQVTDVVPDAHAAPIANSNVVITADVAAASPAAPSIVPASAELADSSTPDAMSAMSSNGGLISRHPASPHSVDSQLAFPNSTISSLAATVPAATIAAAATASHTDPVAHTAVAAESASLGVAAVGAGGSTVPLGTAAASAAASETVAASAAAAAAGRKPSEAVRADTDGQPPFHLFYGVADVANKSQKLHPWRRIFQDLFLADMRCAFPNAPEPANLPAKPVAAAAMRKRSCAVYSAAEAPEPLAPVTPLGQLLAGKVAGYNEWRLHLAELLDIPIQLIPRGTAAAPTATEVPDLFWEGDEGDAGGPPRYTIAGTGGIVRATPRGGGASASQQPPARLTFKAHRKSVREPETAAAAHTTATVATLTASHTRFSSVGGCSSHNGVEGAPVDSHTSAQSISTRLGRVNLLSSRPGLVAPLPPAGPPSTSVRGGTATGADPVAALRARDSLSGSSGHRSPVRRATSASLALLAERARSAIGHGLSHIHGDSLLGSAKGSGASLNTLGGPVGECLELHPLQPFQGVDLSHQGDTQKKTGIRFTTTLPTANCSSHRHPHNYQICPAGPIAEGSELRAGRTLKPELSSTMPHDRSIQQQPPSSSNTHLPISGSVRHTSVNGPLRVADVAASVKPNTTSGMNVVPYSSTGGVHGSGSAANSTPVGSGSHAPGVLTPASRSLAGLFSSLTVDVPSEGGTSSSGRGLGGRWRGSATPAGQATQAKTPVPWRSPSAKGLHVPATPGITLMAGSGNGHLPATTPSLFGSSTHNAAEPLRLSNSQHLVHHHKSMTPALGTNNGTFEMAATSHGGSSLPPANEGVESGTVAQPVKKNSLSFLVHVLREFTGLYGPAIVLLENLHEFDTWSWQLLLKVAEVLAPSCVVIATTRPNEPPVTNTTHHLHGKAALFQKVAIMYKHLLKLNTTQRILLEPFRFHQTKALMQEVADMKYPEQYVFAVMEKTGGMPLYIEKVTEFLCQKPWLAEQGGEFAANVNKMIRNLNFQQVIIERMDRLKPGLHLTLKVASVMGQWVDLDILHKFYPLKKTTREELRSQLCELERGSFLKPTDTEGVWEFNMVERDIVYEVIPHYMRRRLHANLALELEKALEEHHVATLTTIGYHWNQACMGHEVAEVECALKAIEFWNKAAEAAYRDTSLMEALRLYQKAAQIAEVLAESLSESFTMQRDRVSLSADPNSLGGQAGSPSAAQLDDDTHSFNAVGPSYRGALHWSLISDITRARWEKSMAACCLGIMLQLRYETTHQMDIHYTKDNFTLLTEHAIRGLMLLGAPHPKELLVEPEAPSLWAKVFCCGCGDAAEAPGGDDVGVVLQEAEVTEVRDILLVLIIAAEHYSLNTNGEEYTRLLTFCKRTCTYFERCCLTRIDPFDDIRTACMTRIKAFKATQALQTAADFGPSSPTDIPHAVPGRSKQRHSPITHYNQSASGIAADRSNGHRENNGKQPGSPLNTTAKGVSISEAGSGTFWPPISYPTVAMASVTSSLAAVAGSMSVHADNIAAASGGGPAQLQLRLAPVAGIGLPEGGQGPQLGRLVLGSTDNAVRPR